MDETLNFTTMDRYWFLTWTTYGTWLPGDERGYVGKTPNQPGERTTLRPNKQLQSSARSTLKSSPIVLNLAQAQALFSQFQETVRIRGWMLVAVGIMHTHLHLVVAVGGDPDPDHILRDFKAYGSRCLNQKWGIPASETWWTTGGSKRKLDDERSIEGVVSYVRRQPNPLLIWTREAGFLVGGEESGG